MKRILFPALLLLTACGTPQEQCINGGTRDLRVMDRLIKESEGNVQRGYAWEEITVLRKSWVKCTPKPTEANPTPEPERCLVDVPETERRPVAIDLNAEMAKLASLKAKRAQQLKAAEGLIAQCKAKYPA